MAARTASSCTASRAVTSGLSSLGMPTQMTVRPSAASRSITSPARRWYSGQPRRPCRHRVVPLRPGTTRRRAARPWASLPPNVTTTMSGSTVGQLPAQVRRPVEEVGPGQARRHLVVDGRLGDPGVVEQLLRGTARTSRRRCRRRRAPAPERPPTAARAIVVVVVVVGGGVVVVGRAAMVDVVAAATDAVTGDAVAVDVAPFGHRLAGPAEQRRHAPRRPTPTSSTQRHDRRRSGDAMVAPADARGRERLGHRCGKPTDRVTRSDRASTPPSTTSTAPVTHRAAAESRNRQASATSSALPEPAERAGRQPAGDALRPRVVEARPVDQPRRHGVDADARRAELERGRPGVGDDGRLRPRRSGCGRRRAGAPRSRRR